MPPMSSAFWQVALCNLDDRNQTAMFTATARRPKSVRTSAALGILPVRLRCKMDKANHIVQGGCYHRPSTLEPRSGQQLPRWFALAIVLVIVAMLVGAAVWRYH